MTLRIVGTGGDPSIFVFAGDRYVDAQAAPDEISVRPGVGYDGQFIYRLALAPLNRDSEHRGISFDTGEYRQQRIGLPVLAWAVDRVTPLSTLWAILAVNLCALMAAGYAGARLMRLAGRSTSWALLLVFPPGAVVGLSRGLTEPLSWALLLFAVLCWHDRRWLAAGAALTLGVLTRETVAVAVAGLGALLLVEQVRRRTWRPGALLPAYAALAVPTAAYLAWQVWLRRVWGATPAGTSTLGLSVPVLGPVTTLFSTTINGVPSWPGRVAATVWSVERVWLLGVIGWAAWVWRRSRTPTAARVAWVGLALVAICLRAWAYDIQFLRATNEGAALGMLIVAGRPGRASSAVLAGSATIVVLVAGWFVAHG